MSYDDDDDDRYDDYDADDDSADGAVDYDSDDSDVTIDCPYCGEAMYDDAEQCPHCGQYLSAEDQPRESKPWWIVATAIVLLVIMLWLFTIGL